LVRHGQTDLNKERRYQGRIDVPLNDTGREQARRLSSRLLSEPLDRVYVSPLKRAEETAHIIAGRRGLNLLTYESLIEMNFGQFEGKTSEEMAGIFPDWEPDIFDFTFAGGESLDSLVNRVKSFMDTLIDQSDDASILVVFHSGCLRILLCLLLGIDVAKWWQFKTDLASLTIVENFADGPVLALMNDTSHLNSYKE
jgi:alpha-ribazole phosphatase